MVADPQPAFPEPVDPGPASQEAISGCLLGGAIGDALGWSVLEGSLPATPSEHLPSGGITAATQMTLFTTEGLIRARLRFRSKGICHVPSVVRLAYLRWYRTQGGDVSDTSGWLVGEPLLQQHRAADDTCLAALAATRNGAFGMLDKPLNDSKDHGAVLRMAPVGLMARDRETAFQMAKELAVLTHGHPDAFLSAAVLASLVYDLARGMGLPDSVAAAETLLSDEPGAGRLQAMLAAVGRQAGAGEFSPADRQGPEALGIALRDVLMADLSSAEGIRLAFWRSAQHAGDRSGAIAGNLIGAIVGRNRLPQTWIGDLPAAGQIERLAADAHALDHGGPLNDWDYPSR